jgi:hypothetical protein
MSGVPLAYERQSPVGNTLIDDDAGGVCIRILPDRTLGRASSWLFVVCGVGVMVFAVAQLIVTPITLLQSIPILSAAMLFFFLAGTMRYTPRRTFTMILASAAGVESAANGLAPRVIDSTQIRRVFTRNAPLSRRVYLGLSLTEGREIVLGCGEPKEIDAMAKAIHRVLNSGKDQGEKSHAA